MFKVNNTDTSTAPMVNVFIVKLEQKNAGWVTSNARLNKQMIQTSSRQGRRERRDREMNKIQFVHNSQL